MLFNTKSALYRKAEQRIEGFDQNEYGETKKSQSSNAISGVFIVKYPTYIIRLESASHGE